MIDDIGRRRAIAGLAGAGLLAGGMTLLSGCSRGGSASTAADLPVRLLSSGGTQVLTLQQLVANKGYYRDFHLTPINLAVSSGTNVIGPLLNGQADVCIFAGFGQLLTAVEKGADLKILGAASVRGQQALFSKNPAVQHVKDLEGRTVGIGAVGAQLHNVVLALLRKKGVDVSKVRFLTVGSSGDVFRAVAAGIVDAGNGEADQLGNLERYGVHMVQDGEYAVELPEYTWQASFTSSRTIRDRREILVRTLAAYCKAFRYAQNPGSKDDFVQAQLDALGVKNDRTDIVAGATSQWEYLQQRKIYAEDLVLSPERVQYMQQLNIDIGAQKRMIPYEQLIDPSLAREAVARLA
jgi:ABC-type nitrate/sulfonate/bicarbonate transport system substrate-binding protein